MTKGQLSFDFILVAIIFFVIVNVIFSFVNNLEDKNDLIIDNLQNYDTYLSIADVVNSTEEYTGFTFTGNFYNSVDCKITPIGNKNYLIGSEDHNFKITIDSGLATFNGCEQLKLVR